MKDQQIIDKALDILKKRLFIHEENATYITGSQDVRGYVQMALGQLEYEQFSIIWLNSRHKIIGGIDHLFRGTINEGRVYPREVVKRGLEKNAASAILLHNHPSQVCEPSAADINITHRLQDALDLVDIKVLDHLIVSLEYTVSLKERGDI